MAKSSAAAANVEGSALTLSELQAAFQRAILEGDNDVLSRILDSSRTDRGVLFGVYRHAYASRLVEVLRNDHALVHAYVGDEEFERIARGYVAAHPSRSQNARWFSQGFPEFVEECESDRPEIGEIAAIERMVNTAFDAADAPTLTLADLGAIPPEHWELLTFTPHPSAGYRLNATNAYAMWAALKDGALPPEPQQLETAEVVFAWRRDATPAVRRLEPEEAMMWNEAVKGVPFGALCELVAVFDDPDGAAMRAAQHLQTWITEGMLSKAVIAS